MSHGKGLKMIFPEKKHFNDYENSKHHKNNFNKWLREQVWKFKEE